MRRAWVVLGIAVAAGCGDPRVGFERLDTELAFEAPPRGAWVEGRGGIVIEDDVLWRVRYSSDFVGGESLVDPLQRCTEVGRVEVHVEHFEVLRPAAFPRAWVPYRVDQDAVGPVLTVESDGELMRYRRPPLPVSVRQCPDADAPDWECSPEGLCLIGGP